MKPTIKPLKTGILALKKVHKKINKWQKTFDEMFDGHFVPTYNDTLEVALVDILQQVYNDTDTLSWWIYDMEFGTRAKKGSMTDENGKDIPMGTIDDLYKYYERYTLNQKQKKKNIPTAHCHSMEEIIRIFEDATLKKGDLHGKT